MKIGGIGITINRYSKYEDKYHLVGASIPIIKTERTSPTAIKVKWDEINGAAKYIIQYKKTSESSYTTLSSECTGLSYEVKNLKIGTIYDFRVAAYVDGKWQGYSDVVAKKALPPTLSSINITTDGKGFKLSWGKRNDITGVRISRSTSENGSYSNIATITDNSIGSYTDEKNISYGKTYYYKIERFCKSGSEEFSTLSPAFAATYTLAQPQSVSVSRKSPTSVNIKWSPVKNANGYVVQFKEYGKSWKSVNVTGQNRVITGLKLGKTYYYRVKAVNAFGSSSYSSQIKKKTVPPTPGASALKSTKDGIKVSWTAKSWSTGCKIYRSTSKNGKYKLIKTISKNTKTSFTDKNVKKNKTYYYKVVYYVKNNNKDYMSPYSPYSCTKYTG